jgi:hypothetical protein
VALTVRRHKRTWIVVVARDTEALRNLPSSTSDLRIRVGQQVDLDGLDDGTRLVLCIAGPWVTTQRSLGTEAGAVDEIGQLPDRRTMH